MKLFFCVLLCFLFNVNKIIAQEVADYYGVITNLEGKRLPSVHVMNLKRKSITVADTNGHFKIPAVPGDTLLFSCLGYFRLKLLVNQQTSLFVQLKPKAYLLGVFEFSKLQKDFTIADMAEKEMPNNDLNIPGLPNGRISKIPIPLRSNLFVDKPHVLQMIMSPFSTLAYFTNKIEIEKRKVLAEMKLDAKEEDYRSFMIYQNVAPLFPERDSAEVVRFIQYCNDQLDPAYYTEEYYLIEKLRALYPEFLKNDGQKDK